MADDRLKAQDRPSEEILNAFVDGEFSPEDRLHTLQAIASSEHLSREVCDMHQLKELVAMAYEDLPEPAGGCRGSDSEDEETSGAPGFLARTRPGGAGRKGWFSSVAAGVVALVLGSVAGYEVTRDAGLLVEGPGSDDRAESTLATGAPGGDPASGMHEVTGAPVTDGGGAPHAAHAAEESDRLLLHVTDVDQRAMKELLDDIEAMFDEAARDQRALDVQVVVHNKAIDMLRADRAPFPERVAALSREHEGLQFTACNETLARLAREEGQSEIPILPHAERVDSGVAEAARRQAEGWIYVKV